MTINYIIVEIDEAYNNVEDGIVVNSTIESVKHINRIARVLDAPDFTILKKGDEVVVHHNMFRLKNGIKGKRVQSDYLIEDNKYFIPLTEVYMYRRDDSEWKAINPYVFIKPIPMEDEKMGSVIVNANEHNSHKGMKKLRGTVKYSNDDLEKIGVKVSDEIIFSDWSEYEFNIEGETLYKMSTNDILAII